MASGCVGFIEVFAPHKLQNLSSLTFDYGLRKSRSRAFLPRGW